MDDIRAFDVDPFRGLVKRLKGKDHEGHYRKVSGRYWRARERRGGG